MNPASAPVLVRPMTAADLDQVIEIASTLPSAPHWPRQAWIDAVSSGAPNPGGRRQRIAMVASQVQPSPDHPLPKVLGFAVVSMLPPQAELEVIAVAAEHQRLRLGHQLLAKLIHQLKLLGIRQILLEVRASNFPARRFYRSFNFSKAGVRAGYYADPVEDAVLMALDIS